MESISVFKDEELAHDGARQEPQRGEGLGDVEAKRRVLSIANERGIGVGGRLEEGKANGDREQRGKEHGVCRHRRRREEEHAARDVHREANEEAGLVRGASNDARSGNRDDEVAAVERRLHECRGNVRKVEDGFELRDQDVVHTCRGAPHGEADRQQNELEDWGFRQVPVA